MATIAMERTVNERQGERESKSESDERIDREMSSGDPRREKEREGTSGRFGKLNRGRERER